MSRAIGWAALLCVLGCGGGGGGGSVLPRDTTPPAVVSTSPIAGDFVQDLAAPLTVTFGEPLDPASVTTSSVTVTAGGMPVPGALTCGGAVVTFAPAGGWVPGQRYAVAVTAVVRDVAGNAAIPFSFEIATRTVEAYRPPLLVTLWPAEGSADSNPDSPVAVVFREAIDPATVTSSTFRVTRDGAPVAGLLSVSGQSVGFTPSEPYDHGSTYVVTLGTGIRTISGAQLQREFSWTFTIRAIAGAPCVVSAATHPVAEPQIASDATGDLMVAWFQSDGTSTVYSGEHYDVYAARRTAAGAWSGPEIVSAVDPGTAYDLRLACGTAGGCLAAWRQYDPGFTWLSRVWAASYVPGAGWSAPVALDSDLVGPVGEEQGLVLAATSDLNAIAMWTANANGAVLANRFVPGSGWGGPVVVDAPTTQAGGTGLPAVAMDASGSAVAVWATTMHDADPNGWDVYSARSAGVGWTAPEPIESAADSAYYYPAVAVDSSGAAFAVWSQSGQTRWNRYVPGVGWGAAATLAMTAGSTYSLAVDGTGKALVLCDAGVGTWAAEYAGGWGATYQPGFQLGSFVTPRIDMAPDGSAAVAWIGAATWMGGDPLTPYQYVWIDRHSPGTAWAPAVAAAGLGSTNASPQVSLAHTGTGELAVAWTDGAQVWVSAVR
jgi:hypothetical protein